MAPVPHLAWDGLRERNRKGRKLPGEVLQRFKNLSSHSAEVSDANNRFGTWPACTGGSATAALWSGFPTFDGCAVSRNSWRRGAPAECTSWGGKKQRGKRKRRDFFVRQTRIWALPERDASWPEVPYTKMNRYCCPQAPLTPKGGPGRRCATCNATPDEGPARALSWWGSAMGLPPPAAPKGIFPLGNNLLGPLQAQQHQQPGRVGVGSTASPLLSISQHIKSHSGPLQAVWMHLGQLFFPPWDACVVLGEFLVGKANPHE